MNYSRSELIDALIGQYESLISDDYIDEDEKTLEEYITSIKSKSYDELVEETTCDDIEFTLADFMFAYG